MSPVPFMFFESWIPEARGSLGSLEPEQYRSLLLSLRYPATSKREGGGEQECERDKEDFIFIAANTPLFFTLLPYHVALEFICSDWLTRLTRFYSVLMLPFFSSRITSLFCCSLLFFQSRYVKMLFLRNCFKLIPSRIHG